MIESAATSFLVINLKKLIPTTFISLTFPVASIESFINKESFGETSTFFNDSEELKTKAILGQIKKAASFVTLAFSSVQMFY